MPNIETIIDTLEEDGFHKEAYMANKAINKLRESATKPSIMSYDKRDEYVKMFRENIKAPVIAPRIMSLGGEDRFSISLKLSLEPRESWINGIYENSKYLSFFLENDGELELHSWGFSKKTTKVFRKTHVKSVEDAIKKINIYISQISQN